MNAPHDFSKVVSGLRYSTEKSTLLASNRYWDGHNMERGGTNTFLYRTKKGRYFTVFLTLWQGGKDELTPVSLEEAQELYEGALSTHEVTWEEAFPTLTLQDA